MKVESRDIIDKKKNTPFHKGYFTLNATIEL